MITRLHVSGRLRGPSLAAALIVAASTTVAASPAQRREATATAFDSSRAFEHIRQLVAIGPRPPGSAGSTQARQYIARQLKAAGLTAVEHPFTANTPLGPIPMVNVSVLIPGTSKERIVLGGHYDTKLFREFRFVGANDAGSSTAMLLELARVLKDRRRHYSTEIVFFDGEEALVDWTGTDHTYGSRQYVASAKQSGALAQVRAMVLLDMVGDRALNIHRETLSTRWLTDVIWASARKLGHGAHFTDMSVTIEDDHVPFLQAGIPAVDVIDLDYAPWHTPNDTLEAVSARSLQIVGDVILDAWPAIEARLLKRR